MTHDAAPVADTVTAEQQWKRTAPDVPAPAAAAWGVLTKGGEGRQCEEWFPQLATLPTSTASNSGGRAARLVVSAVVRAPSTAQGERGGVMANS